MTFNEDTRMWYFTVNGVPYFIKNADIESTIRNLTKQAFYDTYAIAENMNKPIIAAMLTRKAHRMDN